MHTQADQARQTSLISLLVTAGMLAHAVNRGGNGHENGACDGSTAQATKTKLDGLRRQGTSISGFIRSIVGRELNHASTGQKGR